MIAYKFLGTGAVGIYSGFTWPVDEWVGVEPPLVPSRRGVHACRLPDLSYWLDDELWVVELDGEILEQERMVVAQRGRLAERVAGWGPPLLGELAAAAVERYRHNSAFVEDISFWDFEPYSAAFMAAHTAGIDAKREGGEYESGFAAERARQAGWLADRLALIA